MAKGNVVDLKKPVGKKGCPNWSNTSSSCREAKGKRFCANWILSPVYEKSKTGSEKETLSEEQAGGSRAN